LKRDGKLDFEEFKAMVANTVRLSWMTIRLSLIGSHGILQDIAKQMTLEELF